MQHVGIISRILSWCMGCSSPVSGAVRASATAWSASAQRWMQREWLQRVSGLCPLQDINPQLVARLSQRLFFVVNKVDLMRTSEGLEPEEIKEYVANLVTSQLATEGFQLLPDQVSPARPAGAVAGYLGQAFPTLDGAHHLQ